MKAPELAHACVTLDRFVFYQLQKSSALRDLYAWVKQQLGKYGRSLDFENLCEAGAEADELLWLLAGCKGLPGFTGTLEVFGWSPPQLRRV